MSPPPAFIYFYRVGCLCVVWCPSSIHGLLFMWGWLSLCGMVFARLAISECYGCLCVVWRLQGWLSLSVMDVSVWYGVWVCLRFWVMWERKKQLICYHSLEKTTSIAITLWRNNFGGQGSLIWFILRSYLRFLTFRYILLFHLTSDMRSNFFIMFSLLCTFFLSLCIEISLWWR